MNRNTLREGNRLVEEIPNIPQTSIIPKPLSICLKRERRCIDKQRDIIQATVNSLFGQGTLLQTPLR